MVWNRTEEIGSKISANLLQVVALIQIEYDEVCYGTGNGEQGSSYTEDKIIKKKPLDTNVM